MADKIIDGDSFDWRSKSPTEGQSRYRHLMDGNARILHLADYPQFRSVENMRISLTALARKLGKKSRSKKVDEQTLAFQITGER